MTQKRTQRVTDSQNLWGIDRGIGFPNLGAVLAPRVPLAEKTRGASTAAK